MNRYQKCDFKIPLRRQLCILLNLVALLFFVGGCPPQQPPEPIPAPISLTQALERYNSNVATVPPFRVGIAIWEVLLNDSETDQTIHHSDLGGSIYFRPAADDSTRPQLYLRANTGIGGDALVIGSNNTEFWLYSKVANRGWWGNHNSANSYQLPFDPEALLQSLVLAPIPDNPNASPYPVLRVEPEHNIIAYIVADPSGLILKREIVIDRRTDLPRQIRDYNQQAIIVRHTELSNYESIEGANLPRNITISSPQDGSFLKLQLNHYRLDQRNRDRLFMRPISPVDDYQQIY